MMVLASIIALLDRAIWEDLLCQNRRLVLEERRSMAVGNSAKLSQMTCRMKIVRLSPV